MAHTTKLHCILIVALCYQMEFPFTEALANRIRRGMNALDLDMWVNGLAKLRILDQAN